MSKRDWDRDRQRNAARLVRRAKQEERRASRSFVAQFPGVCINCRQPIQPGQEIRAAADDKGRKAYGHVHCPLISSGHRGEVPGRRYSSHWT